MVLIKLNIKNKIENTEFKFSVCKLIYLCLNYALACLSSLYMKFGGLSFEHFHNFFYFYLSRFPQGEYDQGMKDCDRALKVCQESRRALYRKALCLKELGKYREAYNCTTDCLLISRLVKDRKNCES